MPLGKFTPRRRISKVVIAASVVSSLGIWQAIHIANGGEPLVRLAAKGEAGTIELSAGKRIPGGRTRASADPIGTYIESSKRGMTDQEIRWMLEDFKQVGNMPTSGSIEEYRSYRERQNDWYLTALTEALSLTPEQKRYIRESLKESLDQAEEQFKALVNEAAARGGPNWIEIEVYLEAAHWLSQSQFAPWNLCDLTESQSKLTMERRWLEQKEAAKKRESPFNYASSWPGFMSVAMQDPVSGEFTPYPPPSLWDSVANLGGPIQRGIIDISEFFPLTPDQKLAEHRNDILAQAQMLQPAQLRMALLLNPSLSGIIQYLFNNPPTTPERAE